MPTMSTWNPNNVNPRCRRIGAKPVLLQRSDRGRTWEWKKNKKGMHRIYDYHDVWPIFCCYTLFRNCLDQYTNHMDPDRVVWVPQKIGGRKKPTRSNLNSMPEICPVEPHVIATCEWFSTWRQIAFDLLCSRRIWMKMPKATMFSN